MSLPIKLLLFRFWLSWRSQSLLRWRQRLKCRCAIPAAETDRSCVPRLSAWALFFPLQGENESLHRSNDRNQFSDSRSFLSVTSLKHVWQNPHLRGFTASVCHHAGQQLSVGSLFWRYVFSLIAVRKTLWGWKHNNFSVRPAAQSLKLQPGRQDEMSALNVSANSWCVHMF